MRIPKINSLSSFALPTYKKRKANPPLVPIEGDKVTFTSSTATYLRKYNTLPEEIKEILSPKDAICMFKDMEMIEKGYTHRTKIGQGNNSRVYPNMWLPGYGVLIVKDPEKRTEIIYAEESLGDSIWRDKDNKHIQIIKRIN